MSHTGGGATGHLPHIVKSSGRRSSAMLLFCLLENDVLDAGRGDIIVFNNRGLQRADGRERTRETGMLHNATAAEHGMDDSLEYPDQQSEDLVRNAGDSFNRNPKPRGIVQTNCTPAPEANTRRYTHDREFDGRRGAHRRRRHRLILLLRRRLSLLRQALRAAHLLDPDRRSRSSVVHAFRIVQTGRFMVEPTGGGRPVKLAERTGPWSGWSLKPFPERVRIVADAVARGEDPAPSPA